MKVPPLLISVAALFWGIESGNIIVGVLVAILTGGVCFVRARWSFTDNDFARVSDLTSVLFLAAIALILLNVEMIRFLKTLVIWLPLVLSPLVLVQIYTDSDKIVIGTRLGFRKNKLYKHSPLDFRLYYLLICLFGAAVANSRSPIFFPVMAGMLSTLLFVNRGRAASVWFFLVLCLAGAAAGYFGGKGAETLHDYLRDRTRMLIRGYFFSKYADPFQAHLSFGNIGRLKSSGKILLRLKAADKKPTLIRLASYEAYNKQSWHSNRPFDYLPVTNLGWDLLPPPHLQDRSATIEYYLPKEKGLLPHPYGSFRVTGPTLYELDQKSDGITRIIDGAPLITYTVQYNRDLIRENDLPTPRNLLVHGDEVHLFEKAAADLSVSDLSVQERIAAVESYFADGFSYSLNRPGSGKFSSSLENFLFGEKSGYCELFATATTLLLREFGIPSRYVTGFAVSEYSELEEKYIVRERHAHAWSEAYVDSRWVVVDTTPGDWYQQDAENRSHLEFIRDLLSYFRLSFNHFRFRGEQNYNQILSVVVVLLSALLLFKIYRRMKVKGSLSESIPARKEFQQVDSPFYEVVEKLAATGVPRFENEPFSVWIERIEELQDADRRVLLQLYNVHRQFRYDPKGLDEKGYALLAIQAEQCLEAIAKRRKAMA